MSVHEEVQWTATIKTVTYITFHNKNKGKVKIVKIGEWEKK